MPPSPVCAAAGGHESSVRQPSRPRVLHSHLPAGPRPQAHAVAGESASERASELALVVGRSVGPTSMVINIYVEG